MSIFTIEMSSPFPAKAFTRDYGGPNTGGHGPPRWYNQFGMDLGAGVGTEVRAIFDGHVTVFQPHNRSADSSREYGAKIFVRSKVSTSAPNFSDDKFGAYYTHVTDVPTAIATGAFVSKGDLLGKLFWPSATHLHLALVEIIGGAPGGRYMGLTIFPDIVNMTQNSKDLTVTFQQNGSQPTVTSR